MPAHRFTKMDSSTEASGRFDSTYYGVAPLPFDPQGAFLHMCSRGGLLDLKSGHLISLLQQSSGPVINLVLEVSRENKAPILLRLTNTICPAQGPIHLLPQSFSFLFIGLGCSYLCIFINNFYSAKIVLLGGNFMGLLHLIIDT